MTTPRTLASTRKRSYATQLARYSLGAVIVTGAEIIVTDAEAAPGAEVIASNACVTGSVAILVWAPAPSLRPLIRRKPVAARSSSVRSENEGGASVDLAGTGVEIGDPRGRTLADLSQSR